MYCNKELCEPQAAEAAGGTAVVGANRLEASRRLPGGTAEVVGANLLEASRGLTELQVVEAGGTEVVVENNFMGACSELAVSEEATGAEVLSETVMNLMDTSSESDQTSDSSDDEEMLLEINRMQNEFLGAVLKLLTREKRNSITNYLEDVVPHYSEAEFKMHFRVSTTLTTNLAIRFEQSEMYQKMPPDKRFPAKTYILVFLWFAGHEACSNRDVSDRFNISVSSVSRIVEKASIFISNLSPMVIEWPNEEKKRETASFFHNKCGFSKAIGCIDGTHITIDPPSQNKDEYIDRKGNVTLCMQARCNEKKKFIHLFIGFPGSSHDSWVFQNSPIYQNMASLCGEYYLLGDSPYPGSEHLMTPYKDNGHLTRQQKFYNCKLSKGRVKIEHTFGICKHRFRQLYYCKLRGIQKLCHFIRACCVLHNLADEDDIEYLPEAEGYVANIENEPMVSSSRNVRRDLICQELFSNRDNVVE